MDPPLEKNPKKQNKKTKKTIINKVEWFLTLLTF